MVQRIDRDVPLRQSLDVLELDREATLDGCEQAHAQIDAILLLIGNKTYMQLQDIQGKKTRSRPRSRARSTRFSRRAR